MKSRPLLLTVLAVVVCTGALGMMKAEDGTVEVASAAVAIGALVGLAGRPSR